MFDCHYNGNLQRLLKLLEPVGKFFTIFKLIFSFHSIEMVAFLLCGRHWSRHWNEQTKIPTLMMEYFVVGEGKTLPVCREREYINAYTQTVNYCVRLFVTTPWTIQGEFSRPEYWGG